MKKEGTIDEKDFLMFFLAIWRVLGHVKTSRSIMTENRILPEEKRESIFFLNRAK